MANSAIAFASGCVPPSFPVGDSSVLQVIAPTATYFYPLSLPPRLQHPCFVSSVFVCPAQAEVEPLKKWARILRMAPVWKSAGLREGCHSRGPSHICNPFEETARTAVQLRERSWVLARAEVSFDPEGIRCFCCCFFFSRGYRKKTKKNTIKTRLSASLGQLPRYAVLSTPVFSAVCY